MYEINILIVIITLIILLQVSPIKNEQIENCEHTLDLDISEIYSDNSVLTKDGDIYKKGQYYLYKDSKTGNIIYKGCVCEIRTCIWKCCSEGHKLINNKCEAFEYENFSPAFSFIDSENNKTVILLPEVQVSYFDCTGFIDIPLDFISPLKNGSAVLLMGDNDTSVDKYCIDLDENGTDVVAWLCDVEDYGIAREAAVLLVSVPFLLVTFLVYAFIPELRNLQGKTFMCYLINLMFAYIFLAIIKLYKHLDTFCFFSGFMVQFCFLTSFFWLNVMCFDIWRKFSSEFRSTRFREENKKFLCYCLYAWGCPLTIVLITVLLQYLPNLPDSFIRPNMGELRCFLGKEATIVYFFIPMSLIVFCNVVMFIVTAFKIKSIKRETKASFKRTDSRIHNENEKQSFKLYVKLFLIMGINWILDIVSVLFNDCKGCEWFFRISDIMNMMQGILIFIIFICKKNIWRLLKKRYYSIKNNEDIYTVSAKSQLSAVYSCSSRGSRQSKKP